MEQYQAMTTEQLQQLLRDDASNHGGEEDVTDLLCIMEVLAQRRQAQAEGRTPEEALEEFQTHYLEAERKQQPKRMGVAPWLRRIAAAAAVLVLLLTGMLTAHAMGIEPWSILVQWTKETFSLRYETDPTAASIAYESLPDATAVFESLAEALEAYHMDSSIIPTWIPEGYELDEIATYADACGRFVGAGYESEKGSLIISVIDYTGGTEIEQSGDTCEIYHRNGVDYYLYQNNSRKGAAWLIDGYECIMDGPLSFEEIKQMIDSIEKG